MQNTKTLQPGCYIDSHMGHYAIPMVVNFAVEHGFIIDPFAAYVLDDYSERSHEEEYPMESLYDLATEAEAWLNSTDVCRISGQNLPPARPENAFWGWNDGDFGLYNFDDEGEVI